MQDQSKIVELERRITAALERIGAGLDAFASVPAAAIAAAPADAPPTDAAIFDAKAKADKAEAALAEAKKDLEAMSASNRKLQYRVAGLQSELEQAKALGAQLAEDLAAAKANEAQPQDQIDAKFEKMTQQLDVQGLELQRMRKSTVQLREHLRALHEAAASQVVEPQMINKAMLAELESLRATRHAETAEMDEILAEMKPLIEGARSNG